MKNQFIQKFLILLFIISFSLPRQSSSANSEGFTTIQEESIKAEIQHYFDAKYKAFSELSLNNFLDKYSDVKNKFIVDEQSKLRIEMKHSQIYNLKYENYSYKLDYTSIVISENLAVVKLGESHEVVFPVFSPEKSYMSGLQHEITLQ